MEREAMDVRAGDVYQNDGFRRIHIRAVWGRFAWVGDGQIDSGIVCNKELLAKWLNRTFRLIERDSQPVEETEGE